eukprot:CAMPEP_0171328152 /NCGR_PEP_ID=MMETSP0878-20121228/478_1 /TAXON_ID=67004 /ORGANISM="Thalassiosira weissflogii, Strain CCMP1336" /LENGTH=269 /DNA_ID=CAMNT_0011827981 /DNA_START=12 /DNA_END=821 /DNA_ORIENTATION=+
MKISYAIVALSVTAPAALAFVPYRNPFLNIAPRRLALASVKNDNEEHEIPPNNAIRNFVALSAITLGLLSPPSDAVAAHYTTIASNRNLNALQSSTVTLSEVIRTMDFSLPSSYNNIADPVASGSDELTTSSDPKTASSTPKKKDPKKSSGGGRGGGGISIPKLDFGGGSGAGTEINSDAFKPKSAEEKAAILAQRRAEREEAATKAKANAAAADKKAAEERNANIAAARAERIAQRQAELAKKEAEEQAKREETFKGAKVMDASMPEY